jgi:hypothetical protein
MRETAPNNPASVHPIPPANPFPPLTNHRKTHEVIGTRRPRRILPPSLRNEGRTRDRTSRGGTSGGAGSSCTRWTFVGVAGVLILPPGSVELAQAPVMGSGVKSRQAIIACRNGWLSRVAVKLAGGDR